MQIGLGTDQWLESIEAMTQPSEMVGELKIVATTKTLRRPIRIMTNNGILKYGDALIPNH